MCNINYALTLKTSCFQGIFEYSQFRSSNTSLNNELKYFVIKEIVKKDRKKQG